VRSVVHDRTAMNLPDSSDVGSPMKQSKQETDSATTNTTKVSPGFSLGTSTGMLPVASAVPSVMQGVPGLMSSLSLTNPQWQLLSNGAFRTSVPGTMGFSGSSLFPLASQLPLGSTAFQFSTSPFGAQPFFGHTAAAPFCALQRQQQSGPLLAQPHGVLFLTPRTLPNGFQMNNLFRSDQKMAGDAGHEQRLTVTERRHSTTDNDGESDKDNDNEVFYDASS